MFLNSSISFLKFTTRKLKFRRREKITLTFYRRSHLHKRQSYQKKKIIRGNDKLQTIVTVY
jgi:hypothetical protein